MIYVYAVTDHPECELPSLVGLEDTALEQAHAEGLAAVWSDWPHATRPTPTESRLWRQSEVLEALMSDRTVLPTRFGTTLPGASELRCTLVDRHEAFADALARVQGHVEMGVRVRLRPSRPTVPGRAASGTEYLQRRADEHQRGEALLAEVHQPLAAIASRATQTIRDGATPELVAAYLVPATDLDTFKAEIDQLATGLTDTSLVCTGPWPPFSFAGEDLARP